MKALLFLLPVLLFPAWIQAQTYWQQSVDYTISVRLDDTRHMLYGDEQFVYHNNSPQSLDKIYVHIWPNAYKNKHTALARQQYEQGEATLRFGELEDRGWIDSLDFKVDGVKANWEFHHHEDIVILHLARPLSPGSSVRVETPFRVKIPSGEISRLGHIEQSYQITQWYPKPAVYDKNGWHHMPYLNQGEFYSEYATFDVSITLPKNYVVGATGDLQSPEELDFLNELAKTTAEKMENVRAIKGKSNSPNDFPASSTEMKTIRYTQQNVHDFAWFADKRYLVLKGEVVLPHSGRSVTTWAMFTPRNEILWKRAPEYLHDGTYYYSLWNGDYPYNNVTAVDGTISAGGGMEYPNITVIGNASNAIELEIVIVHEVGHNWFYGQLGTNERVHGWMDEGINTLNEMRYMQTKYPKNTTLSDMVLNGSFHFDHLSHHDQGDYFYRGIAAIGEDQPIETHSNDFTSINYGGIMYQKTGLVFLYLKDYLGEKLFDQCMQRYYREWEFKHPQPEDMRAVFEQESKKDLTWLFEDLIQTTNHVDYKISRVKQVGESYEVTVKNVGQVDGPIEVSAFVNDSIQQGQWVEPGSKKSTLIFTLPADRFSIDPERDIPEMNRQNNHWMKKGMFDKLEPLSMQFLIGKNDPERTNIFWTPIIGGNYYDKFMLGVGFHNLGVPYNKMNYIVMPYFSFGRRMISGTAEVSRTWLPKRNLKWSRMGVSLKSYKHDTTYHYNESYYLTISPYWNAKIGHREAATPFSQEIRLQGLYRKDQFGPTHQERAGGYLQYDLRYTKRDHKFHVQFRNEYITDTRNSDEMGRAMLEVNYSYRYKKKEGHRILPKDGKRFGNGSQGWISLRGFIGKQYISNFDPNVNGFQYSMSLSGSHGSQDLFTDAYYFGRNNVSGIWSQQRQENMGGFKNASYYGTTSDMLTAGNFYIQLPLKPGIFGLYADVGAFWNNTGSSVKVNTAADAGAAVRLGDYFAVYFPIWMSKELNDSFGNTRYGTRIRFTLHFNILQRPLDLKGFL